jgi:hypothetical protein
MSHIRNVRIVFLGVIFIFAVLVIVQVGQTRIGSLPPETESVEPVENNDNTKKEGILSRSEKNAMLQYAYNELDTAFDRVSGEDLEDVTEEMDYDKIYITFLSNNAIRCSQSGSEDRNHKKRTRLDIAEAVDDCIGDDRFGGILREEEVNNTAIVFNILFNKRKVQSLKREVELGIHAIEVQQGGKRAYFKESVPISKNYDLEKTMERLCKKAKLDVGCDNDDSVNIFLYDTIGFTGDRDGLVTDLYRYNALVDISEITNDLIHERLKLVRNWFVNNTDESGLHEYLYYPSTDKYSSSMNDVRMLATAWSMATLRDKYGDSRLDPIIKTTLDKYLKYKQCDGDVCYLMIDGSAKLAYNAFVILALLETPSYPNRNELMRELALGILSNQQEDGSYHTYFKSDKNSGQDFYPGESMLALMKLFDETGTKKYLTSVQKAFPYYRDYWRNNKNTAFIPWHSQADLLLYEATSDPEIPAFVFEMNDWLIRNNQITQSKWQDYIGGFPKSLPRNSTSSYLEGINDAYKLAILVGDSEHSEKYRESIRLGTRFILLTQYTPENAFYIKNQERAVGGFRKHLISNEQRNDYSQHASFALLKALENGVFE